MGSACGIIESTTNDRSDRRRLVVADAFLDVIDHRGPDDILAVGNTHVLHGPADNFRLLIGAGVPLAAGYQGSTFEALHHRLLPCHDA